MSNRAAEAYLAPGSSDHNVLVVLGVCLHFYVLAAAGRCHGEAPYLGGEVISNLLLLCVEAHALAYEVAAAVAPHVEGHFKADHQDALIQLFGPLPQGMLALKL